MTQFSDSCLYPSLQHEPHIWMLHSTFESALHLFHKTSLEVLHGEKRMGVKSMLILIQAEMTTLPYGKWKLVHAASLREFWSGSPVFS